jgi:hypothetical protein|tara:strand:- start:3918 stop:4676 length:759 start_codon:yes stop_codon:yes gene_type:complete
MMSDDIETNEEVVTEPPAETTVTAETVETEAVEKVEHPEWFKADKYKTVDDQAKAYTDLEKKFGSFTGAPETYEAVLSDELTEAGVSINADDPLMANAIEFAKASNMSQEGFNGMVQLYAENLITENIALEQYKSEQLDSLGAKGAQRIEGINKWVDANMDAESAANLRGVITTSEGVQAIEQLIAKTKNAPVAAADLAPAQSVTQTELDAMYFAKDENGNRKINTDPSFKAEYESKKSALHGDAPFRQMIG